MRFPVEWRESEITRLFLSALREDRARLVNSLIQATGPGGNERRAAHLSGQIYAVDQVIAKIEEGV